MENMVTILYVEINLVGLIIVSIVLANQRGLFSQTYRQRAFNALTIALMAVLVFDSGSWVLDGRVFPFARPLNLLFNWCYYFFNCFVPFLWLRYAVLFFGVEADKTRKYAPLMYGPFIIYVLLLIANIFADVFFTIDENNVYARGSWFFAAVGLSYFYMVSAFALSVSCYKKQSIRARKEEYAIMIRILALPFIGSVLQVMFFGLSIMWIFTVLSLLMIFVNFQNRQISTDSLTRLNNRYQFDKYMQNLADRANKNALHSLIMLDIDHFKAINDNYGHVAGDRALTTTADTLKLALNNTRAFLSRYGGDEFAIVCDASQTAEIIARIKAEFNAANLSSSEPYALTVSIGDVSFASGQKDGVDKIIASADQRMYEDKLKNRVHER